MGQLSGLKGRLEELVTNILTKLHGELGNKYSSMLLPANEGAIEDVVES